MKPDLEMKNEKKIRLFFIFTNHKIIQNLHLLDLQLFKKYLDARKKREWGLLEY